MDLDEEKMITLMGGTIVEQTSEKIVVSRAGKLYKVTIELLERYEDGHCEITGAEFDIAEIPKRGVSS
jgi:hypothetical protein